MQQYLPFILEGLTLGLGLAILLGPIFVALTQTSIEHGGRAGMTVGLGIWVSDVIIILGTYIFVNKIADVVQDGTFQYWMGLLGGFILIVFGISAMLKKVELNYEKKNFSARNYAGFWLKGFLVNTINPFTFVFWIGVISTYVIGKKVNNQEAAFFLGTIMITIMITDTLKVLMAKFLKQKLKDDLIQWVIRGAGLVLLIFGLVLIYRVN
ncbi:MAG: LysE family transporter [Saprospiraceae bacterium]|nr:LysE family transporter [Saprospiraceae bacterium]